MKKPQPLNQYKSLLLLGLTLSLLAGCQGPAATPVEEGKGPLVGPTDEARKGAVEFKSEFPGARVFFSQNTGEILWIDGGGHPLAQGKTDTAVHALDTVQNFMSRYPNLFRITDPSHSLRTVDDELNVLGLPQGVSSLRFEETNNNIPIRGKYAVALFDAAGNLMSLESRLMPTGQFHAEPTQGEHTASTSQALTVQSGPRGRLSPILMRQVWERGSEGNYHVFEERLERAGLNVTRTLRDPDTREILRSWDETPSDLVTAPNGWAEHGQLISVSARETLGATRQIPSTRLGQTLVLGFELPGIHKSGNAVFIEDLGALKDRSTFSTEPISTSEADWTWERGYDPALLAATTMAVHLETTLHWYKDRLGHASWDGEGTSLYAGIRGHKSSKPGPELNAWGGGGFILIGDGKTQSGQPLSDALDIVAHEFTHSVIDATASFEYHDEPGALNESLADIFGKSVEGWPDAIEGNAAGAHFRDLADPAHCAPACIQPASYADYQNISADKDHGGIHTNSGIMNRALSLVIMKMGQPLASERGIALSSLILDSMKQVTYATDSSLEEFAAGLTGYCLARQKAGTLAPVQAGLCLDLESSFSQTGLLTKPL